MKKAIEAKYQSSANLFQFCRLVLDHKFGGIRVIDQDVGQILGFDPADCSHWKKGKKSVRSIQAMKSIAKHLGVDDKLIVDVAGGDLDEHEAFFEYGGYGSFELDAKVVELARKDFLRKNTNWTRDREQDQRSAFDLNEALIDRVVTGVHEKLGFSEAPLYIPELVAAYANIRLEAVDLGEPGTAGESEGPSSVTARNPILPEEVDGTLTIRCLSGLDTRPHVRFRIAKHIGAFLLRPHLADQSHLGEFAKHLLDVQTNVFAAKLLAPARLIRQEMSRLNVSMDLVVQLAEAFWVSKTFMNRRLKDILERHTAI